MILTLSVPPGVLLWSWHCLPILQGVLLDTVSPPPPPPGLLLLSWHYPPRSVAVVLTLSSQECCYGSDIILPGVLLRFWHEELGHIQPADHGGAVRWVCPGLQPSPLGPEGESPAWRQGWPWCLLHQVVQGHVLQPLLQTQADRAVSGQHAIQILWVMSLRIW